MPISSETNYSTDTTSLTFSALQAPNHLLLDYSYMVMAYFKNIHMKRLLYLVGTSYCDYCRLGYISYCEERRVNCYCAVGLYLLC